MADITLSLVSEPGLAAVDSVAGDAATLRAIAERLAGTWASTGVPVDHEPAGQRAVRGRLHLEVRRPPPGVACGLGTVPCAAVGRAARPGQAVVRVSLAGRPGPFWTPDRTPPATYRIGTGFGEVKAKFIQPGEIIPEGDD
ncbi:DUF6207 family protein [Streptomyces coeruleorubidus]|uniref:DUF6207 family protein n=1 Tax=Streptomyces coeruleorubidus TaxID=116188 RepID=UPI00378D2ED1